MSIAESLTYYLINEAREGERRSGRNRESKSGRKEKPSTIKLQEQNAARGNKQTE